jgi:hypothetical protein
MPRAVLHNDALWHVFLAHHFARCLALLLDERRDVQQHFPSRPCYGPTDDLAVCVVPCLEAERGLSGARSLTCGGTNAQSFGACWQSLGQIEIRPLAR